MSKSESIFIGVGTNLGDRLLHIQEAANLLFTHGIKVLKTASIYESEPWGFEASSNFYNTVFEIETKLLPEELLTTLKIVEKKIGRSEKKSTEYESRVIDLDILLYKDQIFNNDKLTIPHRYLLERQFVTLPLIELVGDTFFVSLKQKITPLYEGKETGQKPFVVYKPLLVNQ